MAKRKIIWSHSAKIRFSEILKFFAERNGNKKYSKKLFKKLNQEIKLLAIHPEIGINTEMDSIRGLITGDYIVYYEIEERSIIIYNIWDCRQNPENLKIK